MASQVTYCILGTLMKTLFGEIVSFEPKNIQYKKLVNGVTDPLKISLNDGNVNEISRYQLCCLMLFNFF